MRYFLMIYLLFLLAACVTIPNTDKPEKIGRLLDTK